MPENPTLPKPEQVLGNSTLPSPNQVFSEKPTTTAYEKALSGEQTGIDKFKQTIANIQDMEEGKKKIVEDIALRGLRGEELSNAILTLQGKHPHQEGNNKYYLNDKGVPVPLKNSERPPIGFEVASIFGTQKEANDDAWYTDIAKTVYNVLPSSAENVVDLLQTGYEAITDKESEYLNTLKNSANFLKMAKDEDLNKSLFNTQGIDEWKDLADKERWDFTPETIWGTVNSLAGSIGEFAVGGSAAAKVAGKATKATQMAGSVLTNLGEVRDAATEAGLEGRDRALFTSLVAPVISAVDVKWGLGPKMFANSAANEEKKAFLKTLGKALAKDEAGNLTKEAVDELVKVTATGYTQVAKKIGQLTAKDVLQEGGQEAGQAFIQNASEQLWDKLTDDEKKKFGTDAFSPESFAEYIQNGLAGLMGGAPTVFAYNKAKQLAKQEAQDNSAYSIVQKGEKAVDAFKINVAEEVKRGNLTPEEAANAIFKVDAYKTYNDQVGTLNIPEEEKKTVFKLTFEKANLESQIPSEYEQKKLNAIEQSKINSKEQQAKEIQKEIDAIIQKNEVLNKTTTAAKKTVEKVDEEMQPKDIAEGKLSQSLIELAERSRKELKEEPAVTEKLSVIKYKGVPFENITPIQWNERKHKDSERFNYLVDKLTTENDVMLGELYLPKDSSTYDTIKIKLPGDKFVSTASSARDLSTQLRGHFRTERLSSKQIHDLPIIIKPIRLTSGKTVLGIYSEENGKFLSYVREHDRGGSKYSEKEIDELQHMQASSSLNKTELSGYKQSRQKRNLPPEEGEAGALMVPTTPVTPQTPSGETIQIDETETTGPVRENLPSSEKVGAKGEETKSETKTKKITDGKTETIRREKPETGDVQEIDGEGTGARKEIKLRTGKKRGIQKIKDPNRIKALSYEVSDPYHVVLQYFTGNGTISTDAVAAMFVKPGQNAQQETFARNPYVRKLIHSPKGTRTVDELAHALWEANKDKTPNATTEKYRDAINDAVQSFLTRNAMAKKLIEVLGEKEEKPRFENEEAMAEYNRKAEELGVITPFENVVNELEKKSDEELEELAENQGKFDAFGNEIADIILRDDIDNVEDVFQKPKELEYAEGQFAKAEKDLKAAKSAFESKRKELGKSINEDQEDLFGERKSQAGAGLFDERVDMSAYEEAIAPFKQRYEAAVEQYYKWEKKVKDLQDKGDSQTSLFQRRAKIKGNINTIVDTLKKSMPKVNVVYDENLEAAGKWSPKNNTITINPYYAGLDTPIHEYAHVFIDAIGYDNKVIQAAIKQLKSTDLYKQTKERYPELSDKDLNIEVLAEAIGMEGAGIFDSVAEKSTFMKYVDYIWDWLKNKLGINKNVAKSLAKQIISGIGTEGMMGSEGRAVSLQLPSGERINGVEVMPEVVDGFYSKLEKQLLQMKVDKLPAKQWNDKLKGEEAKWTGLSDWLTEKGQSPVTRQEIKDFLKNNRISLVEVTKGEKKKPANTIVAKLGVGGRNTSYTFYYVDGYGETSKLETVENPYSRSAQEAFDRWVEDGGGVEEMADFYDINQDEFTLFDSEYDEGQETKYHQYQLPGEKENYRELLITMPQKNQEDYYALRKQIRDYEAENFPRNEDEGLVDYYKRRDDGLKNDAFYQELRKKMLHADSKQADSVEYKSSHWDEPNILVHLRMNERTDAEGNKVLFLEEVQSDWGQEGKKKGFEVKVSQQEVDEKRKINERINESQPKYNKLLDMAQYVYGPFTGDDRIKEILSLPVSERIKLIDEKYKSVKKNFENKKDSEGKISDFIKSALRTSETVYHKHIDNATINFDFDEFVNDHKRWQEITSKQTKANIASAPFVTDTNAWVKLGLKYALKQAVESGATKIAWTTGEQQNERYDLAKTFGRIVVDFEDGLYEVHGYDLNGNKNLEYGAIKEEQLADYIGKDLAEKAIADGGGDYKGLDLKIGGKGMKGFYDKILPDVFKSLVKELTGKSGDVNIVDISGGEKVVVRKKSETSYDVYSTKDGFMANFDNKDSAESYAKKMSDMFDIKESNQQSITITPELAKAVSTGMPMFQKPKGEKKKYKEFWEMSDKEKMRAITLSFDQYREKKFKKLNEEIARDIKLLKKELEKEELSEAERNYIESLLSQINRVKKDQLKDYYQYREDLKAAKEITDSLSNPDITEDERVEAINDLYTLDEIAREAYLNDAQLKLAKHYWDLQTAKLSGNEKFIYEKALKSDIKPWDVSMKNLSHMTEAVPELQQFSKTFDNAHFEMVDEASAKKNTYEKLGRAVIEETNKKLGITGKAKYLLSSDSAKYFEYMDNGEGNLLTLEEAKAKGLSKAQIEFLKYMRELIAERNKDVMESDIYSVERQVLKTDPTFAEAFKGEGLLRAVSNSLGSSYNLRQVRIPYSNPNTGITEIDNFANIEKEIIKYGNKGVIQKAKAIGLLMHYNAKARKQLKQGVNVDEKENPLEVKQGGEYSLDYRGQLVGKFDRPRDKNRGYSRDFYKAGLEFIDDFMHVKHMSKIVPIVNSLEYMAKEGYDNPLTGTKIAAKPNAAKWIDEWRKMHLFKAQDSKHPAIDVALKTLRHLTSMSTMMFNVTAAGMNAFMGNYNNWRAENGGKVALGNKRLFGEIGKHKVDKDYAYGTINPYAVDILRKYKIVSTDYDSNPKAYIGRLFESLGHGLTRMGEFQIQGSMFLGLMSDEEYNSFEYKKDKHGIDQLVVKEGVDEAKLKERLLGYKNRVSDIQGKYADKDRRNIMNSELGKAALQFKVWLPDFIIERFGNEYINADGEIKKGSWRDFSADAFKELRDQIRDQGVWEFLTAAEEPKDEEGKLKYKKAKNMMANLKGAMFTAMFMILASQNDDDKKKRKQADLTEMALGNLLFVLDPDQLKYTLTKPIAALGTAEKFVDAYQALLEANTDKLGKTAARLVPGNKLYRQIEDLTKD